MNNVDLSAVVSSEVPVAVESKPAPSLKAMFAEIDAANEKIEAAKAVLAMAERAKSDVCGQLAAATEQRKFRRNGAVITLVGRSSKKSGETTWFFKGEGSAEVLDLDA
jgi:hypothetical protein